MGKINRCGQKMLNDLGIDCSSTTAGVYGLKFGQNNCMLELVALEAIPNGISNVIATCTNNNVAISWTGTATTYSIYEGATLIVAGLTNTTYNITGASSSSHTYTVVPYNGSVAGTGASVSITCGGVNVVNPVTNLASSYTCGTSVALSWTGVSGATYEVREGATVIATGLSASIHTITGATVGSHAYSVYAKIGTTYSVGTSIVISVLTCFVPPVVTPVLNATSASSGADVIVGWSPIASGHLYEIREGATVIATGLGSSPFIITSPTVGSHTYTIYPYIGSTYGVPASTTIVTGSIPSPVTGLTTSYTTGCSIPISWIASAGATGYKIYFGGVYMTTVTGNSATITSSGNGSQAVSVIAYNINGNATGTTLSINVVGCSAVGSPLPPSGLGITFTGVSCGQPILTRNASAGATSYDVYMDGGFTASPTATTYTFTGVTSGSHFFEVRATNSSGSSAKVNITGNVVICTGVIQDVYTVPNDIVISCGNTSVNNQFFVTSTQSGIKNISYNIQRDAGCGISTNPIIGGVPGGVTGEGRTLQTTILSSDQYTFNTTVIVSPGTVVGVQICNINGLVGGCGSITLKAGSTITLS